MTLEEQQINEYGGFEYMYEFEYDVFPDEMEASIEKYYKHVIVDKVQRKGIHNIHKHYTEAMNQVSLVLTFKHSIKFIIMYYSQNIYIPNLGEEQPGSTYYFLSSN